MPYRTAKNTSLCPTSKPWAVTKTSDGSLVPGGCHATQTEAQAHLGALANATMNERIRRRGGG